MPHPDSFGARSELEVGGETYEIFKLDALQQKFDVLRLPYSLKVLLENLLRNEDGEFVTADQIETIAKWDAKAEPEHEIAYNPARVLMQDFTGVPAIVDLAAMRDAMADLGGDPARVNPLVPADLVIDHSVQVDMFGTPGAFAFNVAREYDRNGERYQLLRWAQTAFRDLRVVPPGTGIVHQVNLEFLATVVADRDAPDGSGRIAYPDTVVGTDSHTTMVNGLGVLAWGVGGIEAEAALLGQPIYMAMPRVVGVRLSGELPRGSTATDLVLVVTQMLRSFGVVGAFVEFTGDGLAGLSLADRATISNMSPEFGATSTLFPIDDETLTYLRLTGRTPERLALVEAYARAQGLWRTPGRTPDFDDLLTLDLASVVPSVAGPRRPQDRVALTELRENFRSNFPDGLRALTEERAESIRPEGGPVEESSAESFPASDPPSYTSAAATVDSGSLTAAAASATSAPVAEAGAATHAMEVATDYPSVDLEVRGERTSIRTGSVAIAAITSCTNTSNPTVMVGAGLLARNAVRRGLRVPPTVKTSLAPGSKAVTSYLEKAGLMAPLEELGFALAGYGCTTCIGNSGPLDEPIAHAIEDNGLVTAAVLSGNRNFEGRIHPLARASYLASPPLVVAFALAGRVDIDLTKEPLGIDDEGVPVFLADLWPAPDEIRSVIRDSIDPELFRRTYASVFEGDDRWRALPIPDGDRYAWDPASTYVARPPFFEGMTMTPEPPSDIVDARALAVLGDSVTTDHISPAGSIAAWAPAGQWLQEHGVTPLEFNSYGARRGHHEVLIRGTFGNIRLHNALAGEKEGPYTVHLPDGEEGFVYDVALRYRGEGVPLVVIAGREYGSGSSRDWAAKGPLLLGVRAVIAETFERIHRTNLVGMGILPLEFLAGQNLASLGLTGREAFSVRGIETLAPRARLRVIARGDDGKARAFDVTCRIDGPIELDYYRNGGILPAVLRRLARESAPA